MEKIVVKEFKSKNGFHKWDWNLDIKTAKKAAELAEKFNEVSGSEIHFAEYIIPMEVTGHIPGIDGIMGCNVPVGKWVVAEPYLPGEYRKWLSNNGWVNPKPGSSLPAFAHLDLGENWWRRIGV